MPQSTTTAAKGVALYDMDICVASFERRSQSSGKLVETSLNKAEDLDTNGTCAMRQLEIMKARCMELEKSAGENKKNLEEALQAMERQRLEAQTGQAKLQLAALALVHQAELVRQYSELHEHVCGDHLDMQKKLLEQTKAYDRVQEDFRIAKHTIVEERRRHLHELEVSLERIKL